MPVVLRRSGRGDLRAPEIVRRRVPQVREALDVRALRAAARVLERVELQIRLLEAAPTVHLCGSDWAYSERDIRRYARASDLLDRNQEELERIRRRIG